MGNKISRELPDIVDRGARHVYTGWFVVTGTLLTDQSVQYDYICILPTLVNYFWANTVEKIVVVNALPNGVLIVSQIMWRLLMLAEECKHVRKVCSGSYWRLLERTLSFNRISTLSAFATFVIVITARPNLSKMWRDLGPIPLCLSFSSYYILHCAMRSEACPTWESQIMRQLNGLDHGSALAHSFYNGYLRIILPARGDYAKGLAQRIKDYMNDANINEDDFPVQKLIVLIPSSGNVFPLLSDEPSQACADPPIQYAEGLQNELRSRAGIKERVYRGAAYRIRVRRNGKISFLYTIAEGATTVLTLRESCLTGTPEAEHLRKHKADIVANFYRALKKLIDDDREIKHLVDLLYYDDEDPTQPDVLSLLTDHLLQASYKKYKNY